MIPKIFLRAKRADFFDVIGPEGPKKFAGFGSNLTKILCEIRISLNIRGGVLTKGKVSQVDLPWDREGILVDLPESVLRVPFVFIISIETDL